MRNRVIHDRIPYKDKIRIVRESGLNLQYICVDDLVFYQQRREAHPGQSKDPRNDSVPDMGPHGDRFLHSPYTFTLVFLPRIPVGFTPRR